MKCLSTLHNNDCNYCEGPIKIKKNHKCVHHYTESVIKLENFMRWTNDTKRHKLKIECIVKVLCNLLNKRLCIAQAKDFDDDDRQLPGWLITAKMSCRVVDALSVCLPGAVQWRNIAKIKKNCQWFVRIFIPTRFLTHFELGLIDNFRPI